MEYEDCLKAWVRKLDGFYVIEKEVGAKSGCFDCQIVIDVYEAKGSQEAPMVSEAYPYIRLEDSMTSLPPSPRPD